MLKVGDVVALRRIRHHITNPKGWLTYKAEKDKNMVFVYLGQEPVDGSEPLDVDKALERLGWQQKGDKNNDN